MVQRHQVFPGMFTNVQMTCVPLLKAFFPAHLDTAVLPVEARGNRSLGNARDVEEAR